MKVFASLLVAFLFVGSNPSTEIPKKHTRLYVSHYENVLGTSLELKFTSTSEQEAEKAEVAALAEIKRLSSVFSAYDANSEFSKWTKAEINVPVKVSKQLFEMLSLFEQWKLKTNGALDISAAIAGNLWKEAMFKQQLPTEKEIAIAVGVMKQSHYRLDSMNITATRQSSAPLVMNTFTKSHIINLACDAALAASKIDAVVVNIGGDLVIKGDVSDCVNVTDPLANAENDAPLAHLLVNNRAIATSGNYRRGMQIGNSWYSHIIDPRTGKPVEGVISATVIAPNATDAGALATAFNILSLKESETLAATIAGVDYLIITKEGNRVESKGWKKYLNPAYAVENLENRTPVLIRAEKAWDPKYELAINFELNVIEGNSHRPFAAIWVENEAKEPVRNLALWYNKTKWLPDLRNWYRINGDNFKVSAANYASSTGATRSPGKYTIKWDGKNNKGEYVQQGKYTIVIETAKEHGSNEILRQMLEFKKAPKKATSTGNVEISNVTFDYYKK